MNKTNILFSLAFALSCVGLKADECNEQACNLADVEQQSVQPAEQTFDTARFKEMATSTNQIAIVFEISHDPENTNREAWNQVTTIISELIEKCADKRNEGSEVFEMVRTSMDSILSECKNDSATHGKISIVLGAAQPLGAGEPNNEAEALPMPASDDCQPAC